MLNLLQRRRNLIVKKKTLYSIFTSQTPTVPNFADNPITAYELGLKFQASQPGLITAIRYWKAASETGSHTGRIWSSSGTLLTSVAFSGETASGWQEQVLSLPLAILAATTYVVSVNINTHYPNTNSGLASAITNGFLSTVVGSNGVYGSSGIFPTSSFQNSNYFRDVVFSLP